MNLTRHIFLVLIFTFNFPKNFYHLSPSLFLFAFYTRPVLFIKWPDITTSPHPRGMNHVACNTWHEPRAINHVTLTSPLSGHSAVPPNVRNTASSSVVRNRSFTMDQTPGSNIIHSRQGSRQDQMDDRLMRSCSGEFCNVMWSTVSLYVSRVKYVTWLTARFLVHL